VHNKYKLTVVTIRSTKTKTLGNCRPLTKQLVMQNCFC